MNLDSHKLLVFDFYRKICIILIFCISFSNIYGQNASIIKYGKADGFQSDQVQGMFMTYDSIMYVINGNFTYATWDGYRVRKTIPEVNFKMFYSLFLQNFSDASIVGSDEANRYYYYHDQKTHLIEFGEDQTLKKYFMTSRPYEIGGEIFVCSPEFNVYKLNTSNYTFEFVKQVDIDVQNLQDTTAFYYNESEDGLYYHYQTETSNRIAKKIKTGEQLSSTEFEKVFGKICPDPDPNSKNKYYGNGLIWSNPKQDTRRNKVSIHQNYNVHISNETRDGKQYLRRTDGDCNSQIFTRINLKPHEQLGHADSSRMFFFYVNGISKVHPFVTHFDNANPEMVNTASAIGEDSDGKIWIGSYGDGITIWDGIKLKRNPSIEKARIVSGGFKKDGKLYFSREIPDNLLQIGNKIENFLTLGEKGDYLPQYSMDSLHNGNVIIASYQNGITIDTSEDGSFEWKYINESKGNPIRNVYAVIEDGKDRIWGCSGDGFIIYDIKKDTVFPFVKGDRKNLRIDGFALEKDYKGNLWAGSYYGIRLIEDPDNFDPSDSTDRVVVIEINLPNGERSRVNAIQIVDDHLVMVDNSAISIFHLPTYYKDPSQCPIYQLIYKHDIQGEGSSLQSIYFDSKRKLWVGHLNGASCIDWDSRAWDKTKNRIKIFNISIGDSTLSRSDISKVELPVDKRNISLEIGLEKNYSLQKNIFFDYQLTKDKDTLLQKKYFQGDKIEIPYLAPDDYRLEIIAKKHGLEIDRKEIEIEAPLSLTENNLFWFGLLTLAFLSIGYFMWYRARQKKSILEKNLLLENLNREKENLRVAATLNAFNPHLINNSLHWIQSKYYDDPEMVQIVDSLSENLRYIFQNTREQNVAHSIQKEINIVKHYVKIQKIRFEYSFDFEILDPDNLLDQEFEIILLQLQIHIENAIEHGIRNKEGSSEVKLIVSDRGDYIKYSIEDNGVGRKKAKTIGSRGTQSGTKMLAELTAIYNQRNDLDITTEFEDDIYQDSNGKYGTRVIIHYPKNFKLILK